MEILFLSQVLPYPLDAGPKVRAYYTLRYLAGRHDVTLLAFVRSTDSAEAVEHLARFCREVHTVPMRRSRLRDGRHLLRGLVTGVPFLIARDRVPGMAARVRELASCEPRFDAVHADQLWMAPYALLARDASMLTVLDQHNAVFQIPRRLARDTSNPLKRTLFALEARKLARYEREVCGRFDRVVWVTEEDRAAVAGLLPNGHRGRESATNGTDPAPVIPICIDLESRPVIERDPGARRVTFLGGLHWPPNAEGITWFARDVWPLVSRHVPDAILTVIGKNPPRSLIESLSSSPSGEGERHPSVEITGYVSDLTSYLRETAAFVVPLHAGGGMRVKILDAWCWGLPVVSTVVGAEGLRARDGENVLLADTPGAFAEAVVRLLREPALGARLAEGGRRTVAAYYDWRCVYRAWDEIYPPPASPGAGRAAIQTLQR